MKVAKQCFGSCCSTGDLAALFCSKRGGTREGRSPQEGCSLVNYQARVQCKMALAFAWRQIEGRSLVS